MRNAVNCSSKGGIHWYGWKVLRLPKANPVTSILDFHFPSEDFHSEQWSFLTF